MLGLTRDAQTASISMVALALVPSIGILLGGFNSMFGNGVLALTDGALLIIMCLGAPPSVRFWRRVAPALTLALCALGWAIASVWLGKPVAPDLALPGLVGCLGMITTLLCGATLGFRRARLSDFHDAVVICGVLGLIVGLVLLRGDDAPLTVWRGEFQSRFRGTLGNANAIGAAYGAMAAFALSRALTTLSDGGQTAARRVKAAWYGVLVAMFLGGLMLTASRSGMVLTALALGMVAGAALMRRNGQQAMLLVVPVMLAVAVIAGTGYGDVLFARFGRLPAEVVVREVIWHHNWDVARQALWTGYGLGAFPEINTRSLESLRETQAIWMTNSPHDIVLRLIIDAGLPYLLLIVASGSVITVQIAIAARRRGMTLDEIALLTAILIILGSAMIDIAMEVPAIAALMFGCSGLLWGRAIAGHFVHIAPPHQRPHPAKVEIGR